jgi:hypothetical protein
MFVLFNDDLIMFHATANSVAFALGKSVNLFGCVHVHYLYRVACLVVGNWYSTDTLDC